MALAVARLAAPIDARVEPVADGVALHTPSRPDLARGNALHLRARPESPDAAAAAWRSAFPHAVVERVAVCWELPAGAAADVADARGHHVLELAVLAPRVDGALALRPAVDREDWDALSALIGDRDEAAVLAASAGAGRAMVWLARREGEVVGATAAFGSPQRSLLAGVHTRPEHRRLGIGSAVVTAAVAALRGALPGTPVTAIVPAGDDARALLAGLGFEHAADLVCTTVAA